MTQLKVKRLLPVEVKIYSLDFLTSKKDFQEFYRYMAEGADLKVFSFPIVESLLIEQNYSR
jgi:hypothetical protein